MKKIYIVLIFSFTVNTVFSQDVIFTDDTSKTTSTGTIRTRQNSAQNTSLKSDGNEWKWAGMVRFKPLATLASLILPPHGLDIVVDWVPYVTPNLGIPVELEIAAVDGVVGLGLLTGVEGVPVKHKEKSGLYLSAMGGIMYLTKDIYYAIGFAAQAHIGYQLVTKRGFVFTPAAGAIYNNLDSESPVRLSIRLDIGFAYKKRR